MPIMLENKATHSQQLSVEADRILAWWMQHSIDVLHGGFKLASGNPLITMCVAAWKG